MATDLTDQAISDTYDQLLHVDDGPTTVEGLIAEMPAMVWPA